MILDTIDKLSTYEILHKHFPLATQFLARPDLADLPDGKCEIRGDEIYAIVARANGRPPDNAQLEIHNNYIDIQVVLSGVDAIGWKPRSTCINATADFDEENDVQLYTDSPDAWTEVHPGQFAIFFPDDAHAPMVSNGMLHKVIIKIAV
jgi:YhcH/YjgK/YiaL family protein